MRDPGHGVITIGEAGECTELEAEREALGGPYNNINITVNV